MISSLASAAKRVALVGNPNSGKTSLFNALTGLRAKVANYPGITVDLREANLALPSTAPPATLIDLPGIYGLEPTSAEERLSCDALRGASSIQPDLLLLVLEATNLERSLYLASQVIELRRPCLVALNMMDEANAAGIEIDSAKIEEELGVPVVPISARKGFGIAGLRARLADALTTRLPQEGLEQLEDAKDCAEPPCALACAGCSCGVRHQWAESLTEKAVKDPRPDPTGISKIDRILTSNLAGLVVLAFVMLGVFFTIFSLASLPMTLIEVAFGNLANAVNGLIPDATTRFLGERLISGTFAIAICAGVFRLGKYKASYFNLTMAAVVCLAILMLPAEDFRSLVIDGVIGGLAGVLVFLPQICILFFFITMLEDSGYMARGAFVMERIMRRVGLPGKAFVPMLSAHACAIPGIMATRTIENWRDRLVTILVLPLLTCSARLPVYAMVASLLFAENSFQAAMMFAGAYALGIIAALGMAFVFKRTFLPGETSPLVIELPPYRIPSLRNAFSTTWSRAGDFLRKAGSAILIISIVLWFLASYPKLPAEISNLGSEANNISQNLQADSQILGENKLAALQLEYSFAGRLGKLAEPVFAPLGFDWKISVGILSSFAAREVVVSALSVIYGLGEDGAEDTTLVTMLRSQTRSDGSPVFDTATSVSLLIFFVLAMQCLPTQAVTKRETGSWKWAIFQLAYMSILAYLASLFAYQILSRW